MLRGGLVSWLWRFGAWLASWRRARVRPEHVRQHVYRQQTRGMGLRMSEWLRDRARPVWLRIRN
jgi:hypothetical protein